MNKILIGIVSFLIFVAIVIVILFSTGVIKLPYTRSNEKKEEEEEEDNEDDEYEEDEEDDNEDDEYEEDEEYVENKDKYRNIFDFLQKYGNEKISDKEFITNWDATYSIEQFSKGNFMQKIKQLIQSKKNKKLSKKNKKERFSSSGSSKKKSSGPRKKKSSSSSKKKSSNKKKSDDKPIVSDNNKRSLAIVATVPAIKAIEKAHDLDKPKTGNVGISPVVTPRNKLDKYFESLTDKYSNIDSFIGMMIYNTNYVQNMVESKRDNFVREILDEIDDNSSYDIIDKLTIAFNAETFIVR